jgi:beta-lactam-binding protein with PASTA domain
VRGQTPQQATAALQAAGFKVQAKDISVNDQTQDGLVVRQRPQPNTVLKKGRTVVIYVGRFQTPTNPGNPGTPSDPTPTTP